jgi:hypothetical protein
MIPDFNKKGSLPKGVHLCTGTEFFERFFFNDYRKNLQKSMSDILDWSKCKYATRLFIGGSFVTNKSEPNDIDCLIVFSDEESIPHKTEMLTIDSTKIDIQFCAEREQKVLDNFLFLFSTSVQKDRIGIIQIDLYNTNDEWKIRHYPDLATYEIIKQAYIGRHFIDHYTPNGVIVTIPGLLSKAAWNTEVGPVASSQKWIFAPFYYDYNLPDLLINTAKRKKVVEKFRDWIFDVHTRYESPISIIAHSFGTYIITSYIVGFEEYLPVQLNTLILTGSIVNENFNWDAHRGNKISRVRNEIAPNDQWVKHMPKIKWLDKDPLFGKSGVVGFSKKSPILFEFSNEIFDHNNVIKRDVIERYWFPFLFANKFAYQDEGERYMFNNLKNKIK